jgi:hypothetical protein
MLFNTLPGIAFSGSSLSPILGVPQSGLIQGCGSLEVEGVDPFTAIRADCKWTYPILNQATQHLYTQAASCEISGGVVKAARNVATAVVTSGV